MNETSLESIMQCSKEAIARAYMCRAYVTVPIGECPDPSCRVRGCKTCGRVTPQAWEEVLNNAQEWLDELERLREAATPGPWKHNIEPRRDGMGFIWPFSSIESEDANVTDSITRADAAYIVAACNAVPKLIEMVQDMSCTMAGMPGMDATPNEILQDFFEATEPEE